MKILTLIIWRKPLDPHPQSPQDRFMLCEKSPRDSLVTSSGLVVASICTFGCVWIAGQHFVCIWPLVPPKPTLMLGGGLVLVGNSRILCLTDSYIDNLFIPTRGSWGSPLFNDNVIKVGGLLAPNLWKPNPRPFPSLVCCHPSETTKKHHKTKLLGSKPPNCSPNIQNLSDYQFFFCMLMELDLNNEKRYRNLARTSSEQVPNMFRTSFPNKNEQVLNTF